MQKTDFIYLTLALASFALYASYISKLFKSADMEISYWRKAIKKNEEQETTILSTQN